MGSEVAERVKKMLWSITQYAKKLDCYSTDEIKETPVVKSELTNNQTSEIIKKVLEIEKNINELKKLLGI